MFPHIRTPQGIGDTGQLGGLLPRVQVRAKPENESWDQVQSVVNIYYLTISCYKRLWQYPVSKYVPISIIFIIYDIYIQIIILTLSKIKTFV